MTAAPTVSMVIAAYNRGPLIARTLDSVLGQTRPADEVVVVDDCSKDDTGGWVRAHYPSVRVVRPERNLRTSGARNFGARQDWDIQVLWTLQNFGLGNRALIKQRAAENQVALTELFRVQDRVAAEVVQAYSQAQTAEGRIRDAEAELRDAQTLVREDLKALKQTQRIGEGGPIQLLARPLEVVAAIQMLQQAYADYYTSIADYNRAQFQLYRALGDPAQALTIQEEGVNTAPCGRSP